MLSLLKSCGCGPALGAAFVAVYGGSVWAVFKALGALAASAPGAAAFEALFALPANAPSRAAACFDAAGPALAEPMAQMLHALVQDGFVALERPNDQCAAIVRACGVGGVVSRAEHFAGAQAAAWAGGQRHAYIAVPSSQTTRLLLCLDPRVCGASHRRTAALETWLATSGSIAAPWWARRPPAVSAVARVSRAEVDSAPLAAASASDSAAAAAAGGTRASVVVTSSAMGRTIRGSLSAEVL